MQTIEQILASHGYTHKPCKIINKRSIYKNGRYIGDYDAFEVLQKLGIKTNG